MKATKTPEAVLRRELVMNIARVCDWLKANNIEVPDDFNERCLASSCTETGHLRMTVQHLDKHTINLLVEMVSFWKDILPSKTEFDEVVVNGVCSLYRTKAFTINNNIECPKLFIGNKCGAINKDKALAKGECGCVVTTSLSLGGKAVKIRK